MPFSESIKSRVREKTHFRCCLCRKLGVEVRHIIPGQKDGPGTEENAAPLCPTCHELYGDNPRKRRFIREARDLWYRLCADASVLGDGRIEKMMKGIRATATKKDIADLREEIVAHIKALPESKNKAYLSRDIDFRYAKELSMEEIIAFLYTRKYKDERIKDSGISNWFSKLFVSNKFWPKGEDRDTSTCLQKCA
ncbi:MAG TPA: HNH endonuclease [Syntrophobacteraceae bacterium]|nr:HNH endonuclease [Syntrophobacteraceae bacterium]